MTAEPTDHHALALAAIDEVAAGPSPDALARAPLLDDWRPLIDRDGAPLLWGKVSDHPELGSRRVITSQLIALNAEAGWARSLNRWFRLGQPSYGSAGMPGSGESQADSPRGAFMRDTTGCLPIDDPDMLDQILEDFASRVRESQNPANRSL